VGWERKSFVNLRKKDAQFGFHPQGGRKERDKTKKEIFIPKQNKKGEEKRGAYKEKVNRGDQQSGQEKRQGDLSCVRLA